MSSLQKRITCLLLDSRESILSCSQLADSILREIESRYCIVDPDYVSEEMLAACFNALPEHYDPPDPKRKPWHGFKAKRRYSAMVRKAPKITGGV